MAFRPPSRQVTRRRSARQEAKRSEVSERTPGRGGSSVGGLVHPQLGLPIAVYYYQRISGEAAFAVCRFEPKNFRPAHLAANGRWAWNLHDCPALLYHLPDVEDALAKGETIWIVDGEKDADALSDYGATATCCARAQGWTSELAEQLIGARRVRIVADNDAGPGIQQALQVRETLLAVTGLGSNDIEIVRALEGKDAYDHLHAGHGLKDFLPVEEVDLDPEAAERPAWRVVKARSFLDLPEPEGVELLGPLILRGGRTLVGGDSGHGKTTAAFAMTSAVLTGSEVFGHKGAGTGPALIIDLEQGVRSIKRGIRAAGLSDLDVHLLNLPDGLALDQNPDELARLESVLADLHPVLVVLDPYYKAHRGDANEERGVTDLMRNLDRLRTDYSFALLMPAHVRKEQQTGAPRKLTLADLSGSGALSRGAEVVLGIERLAHGHARLRYLKDRDGDLPVGDALDLTYNAEDGFIVVSTPEAQSIEAQILAVSDSGWLTSKEWAREIGLRDAEVKRVLVRLAATSQIDYAIGPKGRARNAHCYSTSGVPKLWEQSGTAGTDDRSHIAGTAGNTEPASPSSSGVPGVPDPPPTEGVEGTEDGLGRALLPPADDVAADPADNPFFS